MQANSETIIRVRDGILTVQSTVTTPEEIYFLLGLGQKEITSPAQSIPLEEVPRLFSPSPADVQAVLNGS